MLHEEKHDESQVIVLWNGKTYSFREDKHNIFLIDLEASVKYKHEVELVFSKNQESTKLAFKQMKVLFGAKLKQLMQNRNQV